MEFNVEGTEATQITVELEPSAEYKVFINDLQTGKMKTNLSGKLVISVELGGNIAANVKIDKIG